MKKIFGILLALVLLGAITFRWVNRAPATNLASTQQTQFILESSSCITCHSANPELPFYASFPIIGEQVKADIFNGHRHFDITETLEKIEKGEIINQVSLAKIEKSILDGTMPLKKFTMVHWGSSITSTKKEIMLNWIREHRAHYYNQGLASTEFANEPIRPIPDSIPVDVRKVELGKILYHDTRLSADNTVSCATCHDLGTAGVDNKQFSSGINGLKGGINAPTVYNAVFNFVQFWDGRALTLAEQAAGPPLNPVEMGSLSFDDIIAKLEADKPFATAFTKVYPQGLTQATITNAIEEFEKTLITPNSAFDRYLKGDKLAINDQERMGYELFKQNNCATCHAGENLGGHTYEFMGLTENYFADRNMDLTEEDNGRFKQTQNEYDRHRFKVPGLRNIELTAPYFHDGTLATLEEAVNHMIKYQTKKKITTEENDAIVAFLKSLTGEKEGVKLSSSQN